MEGERLNLARTKRITVAALFGALVCIATALVQIPSPATGGFLNLGDCFVITAGMCLPPLYAAAGSGIGSALADIITGHAVYAPGSFIIKALMALAVHFLFKKTGKKIIPAAVSELIMCAGYFGYEAVIMKLGMAASGSLVFNLIQGVIGTVISVILVAALKKTKIISEL